MIDKKKCKWCNSNFGYYRFSDNFWVCRSCGLLTEFNLTAFKIMKGGVNKMGFERKEDTFHKVYFDENVKETEKAILLKIKGEDRWFPLSVCVNMTDNTVEIKQWFIDKLSEQGIRL